MARKLNIKGKTRPKAVPHNCLDLIEGGGGMVRPLNDYPGGFAEIVRGARVTLVRCAYVKQIRGGTSWPPRYTYVSDAAHAAKGCHLALLLYTHKDEQLYRIVLDDTHAPFWARTVREGKKAYGDNYYMKDMDMRLVEMVCDEPGWWTGSRRKLTFNIVDACAIPKKTLNKLRATFEDYFKGGVST